jgi:hypothetical protein
MPNQTAMAGSQSQKQKARKYAPIWVNRFISGYWPNRNPLRDASLPVLQEKFYGALNDALYDGLNCELNTKSELTRRAGNSIFDSNTFGPQQRFYSFPVFGNNANSYQRVLTSSSSQITDITGGGNNVIYNRAQLVQTGTLVNITTLNTPIFVLVGSINNMFVGQKLNIDVGASAEVVTVLGLENVSGGVLFQAVFTKTHGVDTLVAAPYSTKVTFQAIGDTTFFADQYNPSQLLSFISSWTANTIFQIGTGITDSNGNVQKNLGAAAAITSITISSAVPQYSVQITYTGTIPVVVSSKVTLVNINYYPFTFLNGTTQTVTATGVNTFTFLINNTVPIGTSSLTGATYVLGTNNVGSTGTTQPAWSTSYQGLTFDGNTIWQYNGHAVRNIGIVAPTTSPVVTNTPAPPTGNPWAASTYYFPGQVIYDSTGTTVQQLTTAGTTAGAPPVFATTVGVTTNDGSAVWTCIASGASGSTSATRAVSTAYAVGAITLITWTKTFISGYNTSQNSDTPGHTVAPATPIYSTVTYSAFFQCTIAGTTSSTATNSISWPLSGTYVDGGVTWAFVGLQIKRGATSSSPSVTTSTFTFGVIGNTTLVSIFGSLAIVNFVSAPLNDAVSSGGGAGNFEVIALAGLSGSTHPTWPSGAGSSGVTTVDGGANWISAGSAGSAANTGYWTYAYAFLSSSTPDISSASPLSVPIIRAPGSFISISGQGDPNNMFLDGVDTIRIYRSTQQATNVALPGADLFWIADIPAMINPIIGSGLAWNFVDTTNDPPDPNSTMNNQIIADTIGVNTTPPSAITNLVYYLGRLWGSIGNTVYASAGPDVLNGGNPFTAFPPSNFMDFPATVVRMVSSSQGLMVYTSSGVQVVTGNGVAPVGSFSGFTTFVPVIFAEGISLGSYDNLAIDGGTTYIYTTDRNLVSISSSGLRWMSTAIANKLIAPFNLPDGTNVDFNPANTYLSWYVNSDDYGLFLSDGKTGWFRMMPSTSPDAGNMVWSPFAEIAGGVSAVQNIEVTPGIHKLLVAPGVSGPILQRDTTVNLDNNATYSWFATFGSVILAHPGEIAMVQAITVDSIAVGSHPTLTVYFDEINNVNPNVYTNYKYDPYSASQSNTVFADRFFMSEDTTANAICRHLQFTIGFPAENAANTVLSATIIGATEYDN